MRGRVVAVLLLAVAAGRAGAQDVQWNLPGGGSWQTAGNWNPAGVPTSTTNAFFGAALTGPAAVTLDGDAVANRVYVSGSPHAVTLNAGTNAASVLAVGGGDLSVVQAQSADLTVNVPVVVGGTLNISSSLNNVLTLSGVRVTGATSVNYGHDTTGTGAVRLGAGGFDMTAAPGNVTLQGFSGTRLTVAESQDWRVADGRILTVTSISGFAGVTVASGQVLTMRPTNPGAAISQVRLLGVLDGAGGLTAGGGFTSGDTSAGGGWVAIAGNGAVPNTATGPLAVTGGTLAIDRRDAWAGTTVSVSGGQLLPRYGLNSGLPAATQLSITGTGSYNLGSPTVTGAMTNAVPFAHTQTYAGVAFGSSGAFHTGGNGLNPVTVTGGFTHSGTGNVFVTRDGALTVGSYTHSGSGALDVAGGTATVPGGTLTAGTFTGSGNGPVLVTGRGAITATRVDLQSSGTGTFTLRADGVFDHARLNVGANGLNLANRSIRFESAAGFGNYGGRVDLTGPVTASGTSAFTTVSGTAHQVLLNSVTRLFNVADGGTLTVGVQIANGTVSGSGIVKQGGGDLVLASVNAFTGPTRIDAGTVRLASGTAIRGVTLVGGRLSTAPSAGSAGTAQTAGILTVRATSTLDFGTGAHVLRFGSLSGEGGVNFPGTTVLHVTGWEGPAGGPGVAGRFVVTDNPGLTAANLAKIHFEGYSPGAQVIAYTGTGGGFEVVPVVPEPTLALAAAVVPLAGWAIRRRRRLQ